MPQDLIDLSISISEMQDQDEKAGSEVILLFARLCNLFAVSRASTGLDRLDILTQAKDLDNDLISWSLDLPSSYEYTTEPAPPASNTYSGYCEIYSSLFSAEVWNLYRSARLGVNGIIVEHQTMLDLELGHQDVFDDTIHSAALGESLGSSELDVRFSVLESLRNDICSGTPFMLGRTGTNAGQAASNIPLCLRTPAMHHLMFIQKTVGISQEMSDW